MLFKSLLVVALVVPVISSVDFCKISVFGSSVANGKYCSGNCSQHPFDPKAKPGGCYQSRLREYQAEYDNRTLVNTAHNGDNTTDLLDRFDQFAASEAGFVVIGLSLSNEGLQCGNVGDPCHQKIFDHYERGMRELVTKIRDLGAEPVVGACYPNSNYTLEDYGFITRMNLLTQTWDLQTPQVNFLGAIDDGKGRWVQGFYHDQWHPNDEGSTEMYYAFVPSLFDAIEAEKPAVPQRADGSQFLTLQKGSTAEAVSFTRKEEDTMHSFTLSFRLRCKRNCRGSIATIKEGPVLSHNLEIDAQSGGVVFRSLGASTIPGSAVNDNAWHNVLLTHYWCNGTISLFVDGIFSSQSGGRIAPTSFALETSGAIVDYQDLLIYRAGLNEDEQAFLLNKNKPVLHASLEVYAPLDAGNPTVNRAQSLSKIKVEGYAMMSI